MGGGGRAQCQILLVPLLLLAGASAKNGLVLISPPSGGGGSGDGGELQEDSFRISAKYGRVREFDLSKRRFWELQCSEIRVRGIFSKIASCFCLWACDTLHMSSCHGYVHGLCPKQEGQSSIHVLFQF